MQFVDFLCCVSFEYGWTSLRYTLFTCDFCDVIVHQGLDLPSIIVESEKRGISFAELLAIPEQDHWEYSDGFSTTCVAFILQIYKAAGLFGPLSTSIQVTEFTVRHLSTCSFFIFLFAFMGLGVNWVSTTSSSALLFVKETLCFGI